MKLLTKEILAAFVKQGDMSNKKAADILVIAKFFNPGGAGTWFACEYDPETRIFFGYATIHYGELGSFSLDELESFRGRWGLRIERDRHWRRRSLQEVIDCKGRC
jgi:hypothetical protein